MTDAGNLSLGLLILRLSVAWAFLIPAWHLTSTAAGWNVVKEDTAFFFPFLSPERRKHMAVVAGVIGMMMLYGGGVSVLLGIEPRLGGLTVAVFCILGQRVHAVRRREALAAAMRGDAMGTSAYAGLTASGNKNWVLTAAGITFFLAGAGKYALGIDCTGKVLGLGN